MLKFTKKKLVVGITAWSWFLGIIQRLRLLDRRRLRLRFRRHRHQLRHLRGADQHGHRPAPATPPSP